MPIKLLTRTESARLQGEEGDGGRRWEKVCAHARIPAGPPFIEAALLQGTLPGRDGAKLSGYKEKGGQVQSRIQLLLCRGKYKLCV